MVGVNGPPVSAQQRQSIQMQPVSLPIQTVYLKRYAKNEAIIEGQVGLMEVSSRQSYDTEEAGAINAGSEP